MKSAPRVTARADIGVCGNANPVELPTTRNTSARAQGDPVCAVGGTFDRGTPDLRACAASHPTRVTPTAPAYVRRGALSPDLTVPPPGPATRPLTRTGSR